MSARTIHMKKYPKIFSSDIRAEFRNNFDMNKRYKKIFTKKADLAILKKVMFRSPNLYKSFINSMAPYNYLQIPSEKNTFLICYNGGPQKYTYIEKDKLSEEMDKKEIIYGDKKLCGCFRKLYIPKLKRSMSDLENYNINRENFNFKRPNSPYNFDYLKNNINFNKNREFTPKPATLRAKPGSKYNGLLKRYINDKNYYRNFSSNYANRPKINYEDSKNGNNDEKTNTRNKYDSLLYHLSQNINKKFHKTQIFNQCKPFLCEGL